MQHRVLLKVFISFQKNLADSKLLNSSLYIQYPIAISKDFQMNRTSYIVQNLTVLKCQ